MGELVSIVLPVFNGEKVIFKTINSLLSQTYKNIEIIVVDDASTDGTFDVVSAMKDLRIKLCRLEVNLGIAGALNYGLSVALGIYIARADADDYSEPERLSKQVDFLLNNVDYDVVGTNQKIVGGYKDGLNKTAQNNSEIRSSLLFGPTMLHSTVLFRRKLLNDFGYNFYDRNSYLCEDYELWVRLSERCKFQNIPDFLCHYNWDQPKNWEENNQRLLSSLEKIWSRALGAYLIYRPGKASLVAHKILCNRMNITIKRFPIYSVHCLSLVIHALFKPDYSFKTVFLYVARNFYVTLRSVLATILKRKRL